MTMTTGNIIPTHVVERDITLTMSIRATQMELDELRWEQTLDPAGPGHSFADYADAVGMATETISISARAWGSHAENPNAAPITPEMHTKARVRARDSQEKFTIVEALAQETGRSEHTVSKWHADQIARARQRANDLATEQGNADPSTEQVQAAATEVAREDNDDDARRARVRDQLYDNRGLRPRAGGITSVDVHRVLSDAKKHVNAQNAVGTSVTLDEAVDVVLERDRFTVAAQRALNVADHARIMRRANAIRAGEAALGNAHSFSLHLDALMADGELSENEEAAMRGLIYRLETWVTVLTRHVDGDHSADYETVLRGITGSTEISDASLEEFLRDAAEDVRRES